MTDVAVGRATTAREAVAASEMDTAIGRSRAATAVGLAG
jgi:hypothetical protein